MGRACGRGSSPQMRGALWDKDQSHVIRRIIPADAGSTMGSLSGSGLLPDHPRRCGEHFASDAFGRFQAGSSPQMRGAHRSIDCATSSVGIIPADAGSTDDVINKLTLIWDHPRRCGEHCHG